MEITPCSLRIPCYHRFSIWERWTLHLRTSRSMKISPTHAHVNEELFYDNVAHVPCCLWKNGPEVLVQGKTSRLENFLSSSILAIPFIAPRWILAWATDWLLAFIYTHEDLEVCDIESLITITNTFIIPEQRKLHKIKPQRFGLLGSSSKRI